MTIIYRCDIYKRDFKKSELIKLVAYSKASRRAGGKSLGSKDICQPCYDLVFNKR